MSKASDYIRDYTKRCSNATVGWKDGESEILYHPWLTPDNALAAVEIERQEVIEKACEFLKSYRQSTPDGCGYIPGVVNDETIEDFRKAMKG